VASSCSLSPWERARVRATADPDGLLVRATITPALSQEERELAPPLPSR
jgi:hypothetical protein